MHEAEKPPTPRSGQGLTNGPNSSSRRTCGQPASQDVLDLLRVLFPGILLLCLLSVCQDVVEPLVVLLLGFIPLLVCEALLPSLSAFHICCPLGLRQRALQLGLQLQKRPCSRRIQPLYLGGLNTSRFFRPAVFKTAFIILRRAGFRVRCARLQTV